jgi:light-regulated signal transduction histidine kinase (bacteriophytochrome)
VAPQPEMSRQELIAAQALLSGLTAFSERAGHDLLGPLNQAGSLLALFVKRNEDGRNSETDNLMEFLKNASSRMERITAGVRKYMEIAGRLPRLEPVDLNAALTSAQATLERAISETGAVIVSGPLPVVPADPVHMLTIFEILIGNSIKFGRRDAPPRIRISSVKAGGSAGDGHGIEVSDNGIGIDPEYNESVFLPFKRLSGYPGAGLGLATAKLIAELHGGSIRLNTAPPGGGTSLQFTIGSV